MGAVEIEGWAFIESQSPENSEIHVVFTSADTNYVFDTMDFAQEIQTFYGFHVLAPFPGSEVREEADKIWH